ncbi:HTH-type transcriptional regulator YesS [compost metagenome]
MNKLPAKKDPALLLNQWLDSDAALEDKEELRRDLNDHFRLRHYIMAKASTNLLLSRTKWTQSQIEQMIINLAAEHLAEIDYVCVFLKNEALLLLNYDAQQSVEVLSSLNRFGEHVKNSMNYISFVLSNTFDSFDLIKTEHERLTPFLGRLIYFTGKVIVPENEIIETNDHDSMHFDESHFTSALRMLAIDDVISQLKALFSEIQISRSYDEYSLKRFCQNLIYSTISTFEQLKQPVTELGSSKLKLFKTIDHAFDIQELESILIQFIEELKTIVKRSDHQQSLILHQIYEYVNENYANDISLSEMASSLHLNYTYLSSYFKQRTHENLTSYISRVRTDKAKELLSDQELSVSEISRLTGFSDHNYFSKVFKKMTGMTPVEYRNQITQ